MQKISLYFLFFLAAFSLNAQSSTQRLLYLDSTFNETNQINAVYKRIISDYYKEKDTYKMTDWYRSGSIRSEFYSKDNRIKIPIGLVTEYFENGNKMAATRYDETAAPIGNYRSWYENGSVQMDGTYLKSEREGDKIGTLKILQFWTAEGAQTVIDGNGSYRLNTDASNEQGFVKDGLKEGMWSGQHKKLHFNYTEKYKSGQLTVGVSKDKDSVPHLYREIEIRPTFPGGIESFYRYVAQNFRVPEIDGLKGKVLLAFRIETDGSLSEIKILRSVHPALDKEALRIMAECPQWIAGVQRGIKVSTLYTLPINIQSAN